MKRLVCFIFAVCALLSFTACSGGGHEQGNAPDYPDNTAVTFGGKIMRVFDGYILVGGYGEKSGQGELYTLSTLDITIIDKNGKNSDAAALDAGMTVEISYDGMIMETFPGQFSVPTLIHITGQDDDLVGLYFTVFEDLYNKDPGLNSEIEIMAFDLSALTNLSAAEKSALIYLVQNKHSPVYVREATFDELCDEGLIDRENLYFETGLLFSFPEMKENDWGFTFSSEKWRSGLGAYFFMDCTATGSGSDWSYSIGAEAIS